MRRRIVIVIAMAVALGVVGIIAGGREKDPAPAAMPTFLTATVTGAIQNPMPAHPAPDVPQLFTTELRMVDGVTWKRFPLSGSVQDQQTAFERFKQGDCVTVTFRDGNFTARLEDIHPEDASKCK